MTAAPTDEERIAGELLERFGARAARRGAPVWLAVRSADRGSPETETISDPAGLLGRVLPAGWDGAAVVATGRLRLLDERHEPPAALVPGLGGGLTLACLVSRRGATGWRMRLADGSHHRCAPESGFMLDVLRRSLQLPTPPPEWTVGRLLLAAWLGAVIAAAGEDRLGWEQVLALHPALLSFPPGDITRAESRILATADAGGWEAMRTDVASGLEADVAPPPELAGWMDEGMFARWVMSGLPPVEDIVTSVRPLLQPSAYGRLRHLARAVDRAPAPRRD